MKTSTAISGVIARYLASDTYRRLVGLQIVQSLAVVRKLTI